MRKRKRYGSTSSKRKKQKTTYRRKPVRVVRNIPRSTGYTKMISSGESKFHDKEEVLANFASIGNVTDTLVGISQGTAANERIGRKITLTSIHLRARLVLNSTSNPSLTHNTVRIILYVDKQCNGSTAAISDILESVDVNSYRKLSNTSRFRILADRTMSLNATCSVSDVESTYSSGRYTKYIILNKKLNIPIEYSGIGTGVSDIRSNNIGICWFSAHDTSAFGYTCRVRYSDN